MSRHLILPAPRLARLCSVRDEGLAVHLGIRSRSPTPPFGRTSSSNSQAAAEWEGDDGARPAVGVGVMRSFGWRGQRLQDGAFSSTVPTSCGSRHWSTVCLDDGFEVHLVHGENGDIEAMGDILTGLEQVGRHSALEVERTEAGTFEELLTVAGGFDLLVAARFHNVVAGLMMAGSVTLHG
jgi:hypothetical protein